MKLDSDVEILLKTAELLGFRIRQSSKWVEVTSPEGLWSFYASTKELSSDLLADQLSGFIDHHSGKPKTIRFINDPP